MLSIFGMARAGSEAAALWQLRATFGLLYAVLVAIGSACAMVEQLSLNSWDSQDSMKTTTRGCCRFACLERRVLGQSLGGSRAAPGQP